MRSSEFSTTTRTSPSIRSVQRSAAGASRPRVIAGRAGTRSVGVQDAEAHRACDGMRAGVRVELAQDQLDVVLDRQGLQLSSSAISELVLPFFTRLRISS